MGVMVIGAAARDELTPTSDYDVVVVLREMPTQLRVGATHVDHRLTDIIFVDAAEIECMLEGHPSSRTASRERAQLLRWFRSGKVVFDRSGQLQSVQREARESLEEELSENEVYSAWFGVNYNLLHNRRLLGSDAPTILTALDLRLLFSIHDLWWHYFLFRGLPHKGEKAQVQYLECGTSAKIVSTCFCCPMPGQKNVRELPQAPPYPCALSRLISASSKLVRPVGR